MKERRRLNNVFVLGVHLTEFPNLLGKKNRDVFVDGTTLAFSKQDVIFPMQRELISVAM